MKHRLACVLLGVSLLLPASVHAQETLFVAERTNGKIARIDVSTGANNVIPSALGPEIGLTIDRKGRLFVTRYGARAVALVDPKTGAHQDIITNTDAHGLWADPDQDVLYVAGAGDNCVYKLTEQGDGTWARSTLQTGLSFPVGVLLDGTRLYITERNAGKLSVKDLSTGILTTILTISSPNIIAREAGGDLLIGSNVTNAVYRVKLSPSASIVNTYTGFSAPYGVLIDPIDNTLIVSEHNAAKITRLDMSTGGRVTVSANVQTPWQATFSFCHGKPEGTACDDGDACTQVDTCQGGVCVGNNPVACVPLDDCHEAGVCQPATGLCTSPPKPDGAACDDGDACTQVDACQGGVCSGNNPVFCFSFPCQTPSTCDPKTGQCAPGSPIDGGPCQDFDPCTTGDTCQSGSCVGTPIVCAASGECHEAGVCDSETGLCSDPISPDGAACSDGDACTSNDVCLGGACTPGSPAVCAPLDACHGAGVCDPQTGLCSAPPVQDGTACNDGDACTLVDLCVGGVCLGGAQVQCPALDGCHEAGFCDTSGACVAVPKPDGAACDDGDPCSQGDACVQGTCLPGAPLPCDDGNPCTDDACSGTLGCTFTPRPDDSVCDDKNPCNTGDRCLAGACKPTAGLDCDDQNPCTIDSCDEGGQCVHVQAEDGSACSDGDACSLIDTCVAGACVGASIKSCPPASPCTEALCDPSSGACSESPLPDGFFCDDKDPCTTNDVCTAGQCTGGSQIPCKSGICSVGSCQSDVGACIDTPLPDGSPCPDGTCAAGQCIPSGAGGGGGASGEGGAGGSAGQGGAGAGQGGGGEVGGAAGGGGAAGKGGAGQAGKGGSGGAAGKGGAGQAGKGGAGGQAGAGGASGKAGAAGGAGKGPKVPDLWTGDEDPAGAGGKAGASGGGQPPGGAGAAGGGAFKRSQAPQLEAFSRDEGGCGCSVPAASAPLSRAWGALLGLALLRRRRRA